MPLDAVELTRDLVAIRSLNPGGDEHACAHALGERLADHGFAVEYHDFAPRRTSVVAHRGGRSGARHLCFAGHIDTVPLGQGEWTVDPFGGDIVDGRMYGRGVTDMKSGIAAFVSAATNLGDALDDGPGVLLVMAAGEETGCEGSRPLGQALAGRFDVGAMVVAEPTYLRPKVGHRGALWLRMVSTGKTAHGSMPEQGINALYKAARAVGRLEDFDFNVKRHPHLGGTSLSVGNLHAGQNVNSVPDRAVMEVDIRTIPGVDHGKVRNDVAGLLGEEVAEVAPFVDLDSVWTDPSDPWVQRVFGLSAPHLDAPPAVEALPFFTDAAVLKPAFGEVPTLILGPGDTHMAHQTDEYCEVSRIPVATQIYTDILGDWYSNDGA